MSSVSTTTEHGQSDAPELAPHPQQSGDGVHMGMLRRPRGLGCNEAIGRAMDACLRRSDELRAEAKALRDELRRRWEHGGDRRPTLDLMRAVSAELGRNTGRMIYLLGLDELRSRCDLPGCTSCREVARG